MYSRIHELTPEQRGELFAFAADPPELVLQDEVPFAEPGRIVSTMKREYPAETAEWLARQPPDDETAASLASEVAAHWAAEEPQTATAWAADLAPGAVRTWALWNAAAEWHRLDPSAARAWAATHTDPVVRALTNEAFAGRTPEP